MSVLLTFASSRSDRNNASQARLKGFERDLGLKGQEFATTLSIVYVGYILMQVPSNMILNKITRPSWYIASAMVIWGAISCLTGICNNFTGALLTRFFLGAVEAVFLPGALFLLSKWYTKHEIALRYALLFCGNLLSNAFGSLIAAGILGNMEGVLGHAAWRWLFFIEGALTMFVALLAAVILPDTPTNSRGFTAEELQVARLRMREDNGEADVDSKDQPILYGLKLAFADVKIYVLMLALILVVTGLSFNAYFPTLTKTLGFGTTQTLLMSAPPWVFSALFTLGNSWCADRYQKKMPFVIGPLLMGILGFVISIATMNKAARYVALFLQAGSYAGYVIMYTMMSSSFHSPPAKRAVAIALLNAVSQLGNIAGSYVWDKSFGPTYRNAYAIVLACFVVGIALNLWFRQILAKENRRYAEAERLWEEQNGPETLYDPGEAHAAPKGFRHLL
ncbi:hypothetical protein QFC22_001358 [Naganishia vaughanmartiniae]|uniref:Uncharacterized protein n=1 Tax=Naganishia vaughanmartiniae TaxID=1424756 RepID=A0ACC2XIE5_9TREE|nr:hypothetical protein QFC22_001358 [Naganishia vaughanmartiniae]